MTMKIRIPLLIPVLFAALSLVGCAANRVDPISPDIRGVYVNPGEEMGGERYFYQRQDTTTRNWYPARELIPGYGHMVYTKEGKEQLQQDLWDSR